MWFLFPLFWSVLLIDRSIACYYGLDQRYEVPFVSVLIKPAAEP